MILSAVGTYCHGFSALVEAFDHACQNLELDGFAQIGHSAYQPNYVAYERFLANADLKSMMRNSRLVVCHAGMGIVGDAMRSGAAIILVPRRAQLTADEPTNDQLDFAAAASQRFGLRLCLEPDALQTHMEAALSDAPRSCRYPIKSDVNRLVARSLQQSAQVTARV